MQRLPFQHAYFFVSATIVVIAVSMPTMLGDDATIVVTSAVLLVAGFAGFWLIGCRERAEQAAARSYLDLLSREAPAGAATTLDSVSLPAIDEHSPWHRPLARFRDYLASFHDRQTRGEMARAALEIRLQRATTQLDLMQAVLSKIGEPVFAVDAYDDVLLANPAANKLLGRGEAKRDEEKFRLSDALPNERLTTLVAEVRRRSVAAHRIDELEVADAAGQKRWYRAAVDNVCHQRADDEPGNAVVVLHDISAERDTHRQHAEFVSAASHEMKAPLAGIKAYVELLADGDAEDEAEREEFLDVINGQADRLQRLIDNLLNIARIEAGVVKVSKQSRSVNEILAETLSVVEPAAQAKSITLAADLSPLYLGALVDRDMLAQAVINLLSNAVKYTRNGGRVTLRSRLADQEIQIEVEDTGVGLSEEDCRRVFEKFYRVEKDKTMAAGTGLGLALAQHIVEDVHGGKLTVRSRLGEGSTFCITIPSAARNA
jgi:two-component system, OmpR family, phosphate regulon sensor histidine kinase PhoR